MRKFIVLFSILLCLIPILTVKVSRSTPPESSESSNVEVNICPYQTQDQWQVFLEKYSDNKKWVETCEDSTCDEEYYSFVKENIERVFQVCTGFIAQNKKIDRCTQNMRKFVPSWLRMHDDSSYGFLVDNRTYFAEQESADRPKGMMTPPDVIVAALPDRTRVEEAARINGYQYLTHDSALGGFRTFVINSDPKGRFDQWLLLNLQSGNSAVTDTQPMSLITVQKKDEEGRPLPKVQIHFKDYAIVKGRGGYHLEVNESGNGKCFSCHTHGMRQLIARRTPILDSKPSKGEAGYDEQGLNNPPDFAYRRLMEFNRRIRSYGPPDWKGLVIPENHGPVLGKAQGCTDCHDGRARGELYVSTSPTQLNQKIYKELSMPPDTSLPRWLERKDLQNPKLSPGEEEMFYHALEIHKRMNSEFDESRFPELKKWFLETPCK